MTFPLEVLSPAVEDRAETWTGLDMCWRVLPTHPDYGKAVVSVQFESVVWTVEIMVWSSGETELATIRLTDDRIVNKYYDLTGRDNVAGLLDELVALLVRDEVPAAAVVFHLRG
ncbi:hypothetical protein [Dactylosporangium sp. CA-233914]|uniref:hypothetical protein n=1 Tax=Dactylosporangium sp. CA-233914 TaxID=3239934 RepID=UPI003D8D35D8